MADIVTVAPDGAVGVTGFDPISGMQRTVLLSPLRTLQLMRELADVEWRFAVHPVRDDRPAFDHQEGRVS